MKSRLARSPVTSALLAIIAIVYVFEWMTGALVDNERLSAMGAIVPWMMHDREYWRIITAMFLHAGLLHVLANSWALYQLGALYEAMFGSVRFATVYFVTGIIASVASSITVKGASVGASGAILGILGAFIFSIRRSPQWRHEPWTRGLTSQLVFWAILNIALGFSVEFIDNTAHIAGLISGLLLGLIPHKVPPPPPSRTVIDVQPYDEGSHFPQNDH